VMSRPNWSAKSAPSLNEQPRDRVMRTLRSVARRPSGP
jgi:hypothetical protein